MHVLTYVLIHRQLQRDTARPKHQPKFVEEPDAGDQQQLTDEEKRQKVRISNLLHYLTDPM